MCDRKSAQKPSRIPIRKDSSLKRIKNVEKTGQNPSNIPIRNDSSMKDIKNVEKTVQEPLNCNLSMARNQRDESNDLEHSPEYYETYRQMNPWFYSPIPTNWPRPLRTFRGDPPISASYAEQNNSTFYFLPILDFQNLPSTSNQPFSVYCDRSDDDFSDYYDTFEPPSSSTP